MLPHPPAARPASQPASPPACEPACAPAGAMEDVKLDFPALPPCKEDAEVRGSECGVRLGRAERGTTGGRTDAQTDGRTTQPRPRASRLSSPHSAAFSSDGGAWDRGAGRASPIAQSRTPRPLFSRAGPDPGLRGTRARRGAAAPHRAARPRCPPPASVGDPRPPPLLKWGHWTRGSPSPSPTRALEPAGPSTCAKVAPAGGGCKFAPVPVEGGRPPPAGFGATPSLQAAPSRALLFFK